MKDEITPQNDIPSDVKVIQRQLDALKGENSILKKTLIRTEILQHEMVKTRAFFPGHTADTIEGKLDVKIRNGAAVVIPKEQRLSKRFAACYMESPELIDDLLAGELHEHLNPNLDPNKIQSTSTQDADQIDNQNSLPGASKGPSEARRQELKSQYLEAKQRCHGPSMISIKRRAAAEGFQLSL